MPLLNFTIRSQDVDNNADPNTTTRQAQKTVKLEKTYKMKYLKLLHLYHNITNTSILDGDGTSENTIIFCKIGFLNGQNSVYYEFKDGNTIEHSGMLCLGETVKEEHQSVYKDMYKVLHDGKQTLFINQPFTISLFKLVPTDPATDNTDIAVYNAIGSHTIQPITIPEFRGNLDGAGHFISLTFEYQEDYTK